MSARESVSRNLDLFFSKETNDNPFERAIDDIDIVFAAFDGAVDVGHGDDPWQAPPQQT